jgi:hypothetical protein
VGVPATDGGGPRMCKTNTLIVTREGLDAGMAYPGNFCTRRCFDDTQCGALARCVYYLGYYGEADSICLPRCATRPCRAGYNCANLFGNDACVIAAPDGGYYDFYDPGPKAADNVMGGVCNTDSNCIPPNLGYCIQGTLPDGGPSGYPNGSCTGDCSHSFDLDFCGNTGTCEPALYSTAEGPLILWSCERFCDPVIVNPGCRPDYYCVQTSGGVNPAGFCAPKCTNPGYGPCPSGLVCNATTGVCN